MTVKSVPNFSGPRLLNSSSVSKSFVVTILFFFIFCSISSTFAFTFTTRGLTLTSCGITGPGTVSLSTTGSDTVSLSTTGISSSVPLLTTSPDTVPS